LNSGDITSTGQQESPPENNEIHAQKSESGGSGDSGGFIPTLEGEKVVRLFVDNHGNSKVLHISDFSNSDNPEHELLVSINQELMKYDFSIGWYSTGVAKYHEDTQEYLDGVDSDLAILHNRCLANGIDSIVDFNSAGTPYIRG
jgi:hypothetical protein